MALCSILDIIGSYFFLEFLIYDDGCHLMKYATNPHRATATPTAKRIASTKIVIDQFHFSGHVDSWCQQHCNPDKFEALKNVRTLLWCKQLT